MPVNFWDIDFRIVISCNLLYVFLLSKPLREDLASLNQQTLFKNKSIILNCLQDFEKWTFANVKTKLITSPS